MYEIHLKQSLGQNFLRDKNVARKIVSHIKAEKDETVVEIGSGDGAITGLLAEKFKHVIAVEIDKRFAGAVREKYASFTNLNVICEDFLGTDLKKIYKKYGILTVAGNLPYHITSSILFKFFDNRDCIDRVYIMVQREVGERIVSAPFTKERGILSVFTQYYCEVKPLFPVSKNVFVPVPRVDSLFLHLNFIKKPEPAVSDEKLFRTVVKATFGKRRKYLRNTLKEVFNIDIESLDGKFDLKRRPEELTVNEFVLLTNTIEKMIP